MPSARHLAPRPRFPRRAWHRAMRPALVLLGIALATACGEPEADVSGGGTTGPGLDRSLLVSGSAYADAGPTRLRFVDVATEAGLTAINHSGRAGVKEFLIEAVGPGAAWLDYDRDGYMDLFIPDGDVFSSYTIEEEFDATTRKQRPVLRRRETPPEEFTDTLWRNQGDGTFVDVTAATGVRDARWSFGATAFDVDGDGWTDLFVANFGECRMWLNKRDGTFEDIAPKVGLARAPWIWSTCAAVGDVDGDGRVDIYVVSYADPAAEVEKRRRDQKLPVGSPAESVSGRACRWRAVPAYCGPLGLDGQQDAMFRQRADGTFEDVTAAWGLVAPIGQYGFSAAMVDFNGDGLLDIYVANDSVENFMWMQSRDPAGKVRFEDMSNSMGTKYGHGEQPQASMGMSVADVDRDGNLDILVTNFSHDVNNIYSGKRVLARGGAYKGGLIYFKDRGLSAMGSATFLDLSWGCAWTDFDNDSDFDLLVANGHVYKEVDGFPHVGTSYEQWNALFECMVPSMFGFREVGRKAQVEPPKGVDPAHLDAGPGMEVKRCSRAAQFADFDNDGRMDVFIGNMNGPPTLLNNVAKLEPAESRWIKVALEQPGGNREGLGAEIRVRTGEGADAVTQTVPVHRCTSFLGSDDPRLHFGLGAAERCVVEVIWPGVERKTSTHTGLEAGSYWVLAPDGTSRRGSLPPRKAK